MIKSVFLFTILLQVVYAASGQWRSVINDSVSPHGDPPHVSATIVSASSTVFAEGKPVTRKGDSASCGHSATGSGTVFSG